MRILAVAQVLDSKLNILSERSFNSKQEAMAWATKEAARTTAKRSGKLQIKRRRQIKLTITETIVFHT